MATNYDNTEVNDALQAFKDDGSVNQALLDQLNKEAAKGDITATSIDSIPQNFNESITQGTDVAFFELGGVVDLSALTPKTVADLNALIFALEEKVELTLPKTFTGSVVLGGGDDEIILKGTKKVQVDGGNGDDSIKTSIGSDSVKAGGGNDTVSTGGGRDTVEIGGGNDSVDTGNGNDSVLVGNDSDENNTMIINGGAGTDRLNLSDVVVKSVERADGRNHVIIELDDGTKLDVSNVEQFVLNEGDKPITLTGLLNLTDFG